MLNEKKKCQHLEKLVTKLETYESYRKFEAYRDRILALGNDSLEKTIAIAVSLCLVCAVLVSMGAVALKPLQHSNKMFDMQKNILDVAGLLEPDTDVEKEFAAQIEAKLVNLETGNYVDNMNADSYDQRKAAKDPAQSVEIPAKQDIASIKRKAKIAKVYLVKEGTTIKSIILPINGYGLWSTMYGFLALNADGETVQSINFYDQAETPGLGGEVVNPVWRALWKGKKVYSKSGDVALTLVKGNVDPTKEDAAYKVDGLAGATLTSAGVSNLIKYWMSNEGFAPYLAKVKTGG